MLAIVRNPLTKSLSRAVSTQVPHATEKSPHNVSKDSVESKMSGWQIHKYGKVDVLKCSHNIKMPDVKRPNDVVVQVHAASVNSIDVAMMSK